MRGDVGVGNKGRGHGREGYDEFGTEVGAQAGYKARDGR